MTNRTWLGAVVLFFAWGFVMHGVGLVLHEVGGHGVAATILACGIDRIDLTYFGGGAVHYAPCAHWTWMTMTISSWAGLAVTISAGAGAMVLQRCAGFAPLTRLLVALLGTGLLLVQLAYATSGGFYGLADPAPTAHALAARGLHVVAWLPPLVLFAASALVGARAIVDAFREHFGSRTRLHALKQMAATLGVSGLLYFVVYRIERAIRADPTMGGVAFKAERLAAARNQAPPFPIGRVLVAIVVVAFAVALARPVPREHAVNDATGAILRRHATIVAVALLVCFVAITLLVRV